MYLTRMLANSNVNNLIGGKEKRKTESDLGPVQWNKRITSKLTLDKENVKLFRNTRKNKI